MRDDFEKGEVVKIVHKFYHKLTVVSLRRKLIYRAARCGCMDVRRVSDARHGGAAVAVGSCNANFLPLLTSDRVRGMFTRCRAVPEHIWAELFLSSVTSPHLPLSPFPSPHSKKHHV